MKSRIEQAQELLNKLALVGLKVVVNNRKLALRPQDAKAKARVTENILDALRAFRPQIGELMGVSILNNFKPKAKRISILMINPKGEAVSEVSYLFPEEFKGDWLASHRWFFRMMREKCKPKGWTWSHRVELLEPCKSQM